MIETDDRTVAFVYGASAHESLANGIAAAADLVAGQPGPWTLSDDDRARWAAEVAGRVTDGGDLIATLLQARRELGLLAAELGAQFPGHLTHQVQQLDDRIGSFLGSYPSIESLRLVLVDAPSSRSDSPPASPVPGSDLPTVEDATGYRRDQWMALMQRLSLSTPTILAAFRQDAKAAGLVWEGIGLADVTGVEAYTRLLLHVIAEAGA